MVTGSGFGKLNSIGSFLSIIQLEFVIIERLSALIVVKSLGYVEKSKNGRMAERPMAPSWKGGEGQPSVGSNPTSSSKVVCLVVGQLRLATIRPTA